MICEEVVQKMNDPLILYAAYLDRAVLRRNGAEQELVSGVGLASQGTGRQGSVPVAVCRG